MIARRIAGRNFFPLRFAQGLSGQLSYGGNVSILAEYSERRTVPLRHLWCMIDPMDTTKRDPKDVSDNKDLAALSYVWVLSLVVLFAKRESPFVQFHARQGAVLFGLSLVVWAMPFVGKVAELLVLALCIIGFLHAAQSEWREIPIIGPLSRGAFGDLRHSWRDVVAACAALWARIRKTVPSSQPSTTPAQPASSSPAPIIDVAVTEHVKAESSEQDTPVVDPLPVQDVPVMHDVPVTDAPSSDASSSDSSSSSSTD